MSLAEFKDSMLPAIETELQNCVQSVSQTGLNDLYTMLAYHLGWEGEGAGPIARGKRIRPLLLLLTTASLGKDWEIALPGAAAVELVHNFSLIHDDIQDQSPLRRGRPTLWKIYGIPQAINAGDSMFALAQIALQNLDTSVPAEIALKAYQIIPYACLTLTQGQFLDLAYEDKKDISTSDYWLMIRGKTAALLATCTELGAILAFADKDTQKNLRNFGEFIGLAFQVQDDILGIWGDSALTGKSVESDLVTRKKSLPVLFALEKGGEFAKRWQKKSINPEEVPKFAEILKEEGAYTYAKEQVDKLTNQALDWFEKANVVGPAADALIELSNQLVHRER
jgi:geranylgeranyl diphosphate synthase type I